MKSRSGFTLVEILVVVAIIIILVGALLAVGTGQSDRARAQKTQGILGRIEFALESYHCEFGDYPPDGYDYSVLTYDGYPIRGSACLAYFLAWKKPDGASDPRDFVLTKQSYAEDPVNPITVEAHRGQPYLEIEKRLITKEGEIVDGWGNPIHYDNCAYDPKSKQPRYSPNPAGMHSCSDPDPREVRSPRGPFNPGTFDLWSKGRDGHKKGATAENDITRGERAR